MTRKSLPPADKHGLTDIARLPTPDRPIVHIDLTGPLKGNGTRQFFATWGSPEMVRASAECEGSCCCYGQTGERKPVAERLHRPWRGQIFVADVDGDVERWKRNGYEVQVHDRTRGV
jgi:hypothetical protein